MPGGPARTPTPTPERAAPASYPPGFWSRPVQPGVGLGPATLPRHSHSAGTSRLQPRRFLHDRPTKSSPPAPHPDRGDTPLTCGNAGNVTRTCEPSGRSRKRLRIPNVRYVESSSAGGPDSKRGSQVISKHGETDRRFEPRNTSDPRISIVVPALNEALNLAVVLPQLPTVHEVILVDGGSVDGTVDAARRALPGIITVLQTRKGKGNALAAGFARVTGDIVVMFDADGSADPAEIARFVEALKRRRRLRQGLALHRRRRLGRHHPGPAARQPVPQRHLQPRLPDPLHRPLLRLQRLLGRPDPAARPARPHASRRRPTAR